MTTTSLAVGLIARTRRFAAPTDLVDALGPGGFAWLTGSNGFVTSGEVVRLPASDIETALALLAVDDDVQMTGTGAIAVGALPFADAEAGDLVIPARVVGRSEDGRGWMTVIGATTEPATEPALAPTRFVIEPGVGRTEWCRRVEVLLDAIGTGRLQKAVLARDVVVTMDRALDPRTVVARLQRGQAGSYVYATDGFVGASPELLVRRHGRDVVSRPMAGTVARGATAEADARASVRLERSDKDAREHRLVVEAVVDGLQRGGVEVEPVGGPELAQLADVSHLMTRVRGHLDGAHTPSALTLARALHPTPAVGGTPRDAALELLGSIEHLDRGRYAGPVGWVDASGDGEWVVALRCAELAGRRARLFAGAGIVAGSDPEAEWHETEVKLEPMLRAIVRP
jgi:menaquinone-specific isochorismate synthase